MIAPRSVLLYWLLLLLPTLGAGGGAFWLLQREQTRIDAQAAAAAESSRAAIEARARLIVENIELFIGDVQTGLMESLRALPAGQEAPALDEWEKTNPLVRTTFLTDSQRQLLRPTPSGTGATERTSLQAWLLSNYSQSKIAASPSQERDAEPEVRREVSSNVATVQSARSAVKDVAGLRTRQDKHSEYSSGEQTGWTPWRDSSGLHLIGWRTPAAGNGALVGVVVQLSEIRTRLESLLPREGELADAFLLRDRGAVIQEKRYRASSPDARAKSAVPEVVVPVATSFLPGWEVVGVAGYSPQAGNPGRGFLLIGGILVATFMAAILAGGGLLLDQASRSAAEAARKTSFVANVSHEFKTPLTTIRLYAELLAQKRVKDAGQASDYLHVIGQETERLTRLVNNALDFSRLEQGQKRYHPVPIDLTTEITRILEVQAPRMAEARMQLIRRLPDSPTSTSLDRDAFKQILLNLIDNACKYAAEGAELLVTLESLPKGFRIQVSDRGPGVPAGHRERIFEKFHRVNNDLTSAQNGAGLGLSIARQLARGLGGDLHHEPRSGGGSVFVLTLP
ncbi:MAG: HAMP domain-containing histidine kinase [Opitutaceae bacterium]|nr:HAMP domain-containing histidine kinase [Opitutaceae bacterium]